MEIIKQYPEGVCIIKESGRYGIADKDMNILLPCECDSEPVQLWEDYAFLYHVPSGYGIFDVENKDDLLGGVWDELLFSGEDYSDDCRKYVWESLEDCMVRGYGSDFILAEKDGLYRVFSFDDNAFLCTDEQCTPMAGERIVLLYNDYYDDGSDDGVPRKDGPVFAVWNNGGCSVVIYEDNSVLTMFSCECESMSVVSGRGEYGFYFVVRKEDGSIGIYNLFGEENIEIYVHGVSRDVSIRKKDGTLMDISTDGLDYCYSEEFKETDNHSLVFVSGDWTNDDYPEDDLYDEHGICLLRSDDSSCTNAFVKVRLKNKGPVIIPDGVENVNYITLEESDFWHEDEDDRWIYACGAWRNVYIPSSVKSINGILGACFPEGGLGTVVFGGSETNVFEKSEFISSEAGSEYDDAGYYNYYIQRIIVPAGSKDHYIGQLGEGLADAIIEMSTEDIRKYIDEKRGQFREGFDEYGVKYESGWKEVSADGDFSTCDAIVIPDGVESVVEIYQGNYKTELLDIFIPASVKRITSLMHWFGTIAFEAADTVLEGMQPAVGEDGELAFEKVIIPCGSRKHYLQQLGDIFDGIIEEVPQKDIRKFFP